MREARRTHKVVKQHLRRFQKIKLEIQQQNKMLAGVHATASLMTDEVLLQTPNTSVVVVAGSSPFVLLKGKPLIFLAKFLQAELLSTSRYLTSTKCYSLDCCSTIRL